MFRKLLTFPRKFPVFSPSFATKSPPSPKDIVIPKDKLSLSFSRSSGPGGQNVNKVNTKVEIRFKIDDADWLSSEVRAKLKEINRNSINSQGELILTSQTARTQERNREDCYEKLRNLVWEASLTEKERLFLIPPETQEKARRRVNEKRKRSEVKRNRSGRSDF